MTKHYILSDPNFSEGTDKETIEAIVDCYRGKKGIKVIEYEPDPDFGRLPIEIIAEAEPFKQATIEAAGVAFEKIDMTKFTGKHPQIGAFDTCEIYPCKGTDIEFCKQLAVEIAEAIWAKYQVPVYYTGKNATKPENEGLTNIRKGNFKGAVVDVPNDPNRFPDLGEGKLHPTAGAVVVGALEQHDAYFNVILDTDDVTIAKKLATAVRGKTGGFTAIQGTIGLPQVWRRTGQALSAVSCEITNPLNTPIHRVYNTLVAEAERWGVRVLAGQICGVISAEVLCKTAEWYLKLEAINGPWDYQMQILENHLLALQDESED